MAELQTSHVLNQVRWPGAGDVDDCWVVSGIQLVNTVAPWLRLPSVPAFRRAAGDPDDGHRDGGTVREVIRGIRTLWPRYGSLFELVEAGRFFALRDEVEAGRPASLAIIAAELPARLRHGFTGSHQVTVAYVRGELLVANPLAPVYSSWQPAAWADVRRAAAAHAGTARVNAVLAPLPALTLALHPLEDEIASAATAAAIDAAAAIVADAAAKLAALRRFPA